VQCLTFLVTGRPAQPCPDIPGPSSDAPSSAPSIRACSIPDDERDIDWEDYNYLPENDKGGDGGRLSDEAFASMMDMIPEFYAEKLDALLCYLLMPDEAEVPGLILEEAIWVCVI
jgi:hypothetical protein